MNKPPIFQTETPLWSISQPTMDRLNSARQDSEKSEFLLCGLYCAVAVFFLIIFGIAALLREDVFFAYVIFGFAITTVISYTFIWLGAYFFLAKHLVASLMGSLCLYLFYSGGTEGTGPIYYFVFPTVALFLQGFKQGAVSTILLLLITAIIYNGELFGFDASLYSYVFISRVLTIYLIISILSFLFAYSRQAAERELLLIREDVEQLSTTDQLTGLANRNFMDKMLAFESNRYKPNQSSFCLMMIRIDPFDKFKKRTGRAFHHYILPEVANILRKVLQIQDIPCRWGRDEFLVLLPQQTLDEAQQIAERLLKNINNHAFSFREQSPEITLSIGLCQANSSNLSETIDLVDKNLFLAIQNSGSCIVNSPAQDS